ncbi:uncharacterized protein LOC135411754 [Pseudopipra pipra]|uniref:uncharacterized protein LOC135411754 n=1 Tax=Pseudopipra pipra TaxID=415032 RepID=UPI00313862F2
MYIREVPQKEGKDVLSSLNEGPLSEGRCHRGPQKATVTGDPGPTREASARPSDGEQLLRNARLYRPLSYLQVTFSSSTYGPSAVLASLPNRRGLRSSLAAGRGLWSPSPLCAGRGCDPGSSPPPSPAVHPSRPGMCAEPSRPRLWKLGWARGNARGQRPVPGGASPALGSKRAPASSISLFGWKYKSENNPSGESRRYLAVMF